MVRMRKQRTPHSTLDAPEVLLGKPVLQALAAAADALASAEAANELETWAAAAALVAAKASQGQGCPVGLKAGRAKRAARTSKGMGQNAAPCAARAQPRGKRKPPIVHDDEEIVEELVIVDVRTRCGRSAKRLRLA